MSLKKKMCEKAFNEWVMQKKEEEKRRRGQYDANEFERDEQVDYQANFQEFIDSVVSDNQRSKEGEYNTPQQQKLIQESITGSKKSKKS